MQKPLNHPGKRGGDLIDSPARAWVGYDRLIVKNVMGETPHALESVATECFAPHAGPIRDSAAV